MMRLATALLAVSLLAGCGAGLSPTLPRAAAGAGVGALSKGGVQKAMRGMFKYDFERFDADKNGVLTVEEIAAPPLSSAAAFGDPATIKRAELARLDANGDGKVTLREYSRPELFQPVLQRFRQAQALEFAKRDANSDRQLSPPELTGAPIAFEAFDRNGNGKVTVSEFEDAMAQFFADNAAPKVDPPAPSEPSDDSYDPNDDPSDDPNAADQ